MVSPARTCGPYKSAAGKPPLVSVARDVTTTAVRRDPAITAIKQLVHAGQLREHDQRPGPQNLSCQKDYRIGAGDIVRLGRQNMHLFEWGIGLEAELPHHPFCLQGEKEKSAAAKYSIKPPS
jgi:hypothetical protein